MRAAVDCEETDQGGVRVETVEMPVEEKLGSHGSKAILLSHAWRVEPPSHLSLPTCQHGS